MVRVGLTAAVCVGQLSGCNQRTQNTIEGPREIVK